MNRALPDRSQVEAAVAEVVRCGLPPHKDHPKNWDLLVALGTILGSTGPADPVLEMGAPRYSRLLPWLAMYEYRDLVGIDLVFEASLREGPTLRAWDLTGDQPSQTGRSQPSPLSVSSTGGHDATLRERAAAASRRIS